MKKRDYPRLLPAAMAALFLVANHACGDSYELAKVKGMEAFNGSAGAKDLLGKNGFVVADPGFKPDVILRGGPFTYDVARYELQSEQDTHWRSNSMKEISVIARLSLIFGIAAVVLSVGLPSFGGSRKSILTGTPSGRSRRLPTTSLFTCGRMGC